MPQENSVEKVGDLVVRFKTSKLGVAVYRQRYTEGHGAHKVDRYSRPFYFGKTANGVLTRFPLGVDMRKAEKLAEEIAAFLTLPTNSMAMAVAKYNPRIANRATVSTFAEVLEVYEKNLGIIGRKGKAVGKPTFSGYRSFLLIMLRKVEAYRKDKTFESFSGQHDVDFTPWLKLPLSVLTTKFAMDLKLASLPVAADDDDEPDEEEILTAKITADTTLRNTRALFSKRAIAIFRQESLNIPDLSGFMSEPDFGAKKYFQLLPPEVIVSMVRASLELRETDPNAYRAYLLCMHCGFRRKEALAFHTSWLRDEDEPRVHVTANGVFNPKHGHGRKVVLERWVFDLLNELGEIREPAALDRLNDWAKALIPKEHAVDKPLHELRKCWVSYKAKTDGIHAASKQAGHKDVRVTDTSYADNLMAERLIPLWREPTDAALLKFHVA